MDLAPCPNVTSSKDAKREVFLYGNGIGNNSGLKLRKWFLILGNSLFLVTKSVMETHGSLKQGNVVSRLETTVSCAISTKSPFSNHKIAMSLDIGGDGNKMWNP